MAKFNVYLLRSIPGNAPGRYVDLEELEHHVIEAADATIARNVFHDNLRTRPLLPEGALFVHAHQVRD